jgi:purine nucleosidase
VLCPLDITNRAPVTKRFIDRLRAQSRFQLSRLATDSYAKAMSRDSALFFWDVLATSYIGRPEMFQLRDWETVIVTEGPSAGRIKAQTGGRRIRALDRVDLDQFHSYL